MRIQIIQSRIYEVRGHKVMLDFDLADLYDVETRRLNEQVKRNRSRFPADFMFRLTAREWKDMMSQFATSSESRIMRSQFATASLTKRKVSAAPYAFTEHGVSMVASILKSDKAVKMNIAIVRAFIALKKFAINYDKLAREIKELKQITGRHNIQLRQIYEALENIMNEKEERTRNWEERERIGFKPDK